MVNEELVQIIAFFSKQSNNYYVVRSQENEERQFIIQSEHLQPIPTYLLQIKDPAYSLQQRNATKTTNYHPSSLSIATSLPSGIATSSNSQSITTNSLYKHPNEWTPNDWGQWIEQNETLTAKYIKSLPQDKVYSLALADFKNFNSSETSICALESCLKSLAPSTTSTGNLSTKTKLDISLEKAKSRLSKLSQTLTTNFNKF